MTELISLWQADAAIFFISISLVLAGAAWGLWRYKLRGLAFCAPGLLIAPLWQLHLWLTAYNPATKTLGLSSLKVVLSEFVLFAIIGMAVGWFFSFVCRAPSGNSSRQTSGE